MNRILRSVDRAEWKVENLGDYREKRLLDGKGPLDVLECVLDESKSRACKGEVKLEWQESDEKQGFYRVCTQIELQEETFDQLFNGSSGYRAQYYLSPEEGVLYNNQLVVGLEETLDIAYKNSPQEIEIELLKCSLFGPHSKIWVFEEQEAFDSAACNTVNPPRWVKNGATRGPRAPLPNHLKVDIKGTFIKPGTQKFS